jgi:hypothetical protein
MFTKRLELRVATLEESIAACRIVVEMLGSESEDLSTLLKANSELMTEVASLLRRLTIAHPVRIGRKGNKRPLNQRIEAAKAGESYTPETDALFPVDSRNGSGI